MDDSVIYGKPYETADGATIITVAAFDEFGARPVGVFVVHGGEVVWKPARDRVAVIKARTALVAVTIGTITGLTAAGLAAAALVRRPPWPDLRITKPC
ncbi:hypothetical protein ACFVMC_26780 [Nocardia sp. NPDC127579]|uniref:hypothetical protein n=1 Tax=Nocardia sp. NPDC127579 TaxID=3345402 RepID=UPI003632F8A7